MMVVSFFVGITHERLRTKTVYPKSLCIPSFGLLVKHYSYLSLRPRPSEALTSLAASQIGGSTSLSKNMTVQLFQPENQIICLIFIDIRPLSNCLVTLKIASRIRRSITEFPCVIFQQRLLGYTVLVPRGSWVTPTKNETTIIK